MAKIVALSGKGGVGKTSISSLLLRALRKIPGKRILAIDGDPAGGLSTALGLSIHKTLDDIRMEIIDEGKNGKKESKATILQRLDYELADALIEERGFAFLSIGRPESKGCYCKINEFLKQMIGDLVENFDYVIIDGEAGIEQINRRVMERVTHLLLVSDDSLKGIKVAKTIYQVAQTSMTYEKAGLLLNRVKEYDPDVVADIKPLELVGVIKENDALHRSDVLGESLLSLQDDAAIQECESILLRFVG